MQNNLKEKYSEIFKKIKEQGLFTEILYTLEQYSEKDLLKEELNNIGIDWPLHSINNKHYSKFNENIFITTLDGDKSIISWPDDGKQPIGTFLVFNFPTGAYLFDRDYPSDLFNQFFDELKSLGPSNIDSNNHKLYFPLLESANAFNSYSNILKKYMELNKIDRLHRKMQKAQKELDEMKAKLNQNQ